MTHKGNERRIARRDVLRLAVAGPLAGLLAACASSAPGRVVVDEVGGKIGELGSAVEPTATPVPEPPFVIPAGDQTISLMAGTAYQTPLYVFGSGLPGPALMVLGGVHGNEPGGWFAAERLVDRLRPRRGALLVVPRANRVADAALVRTTDEMGDLNRLYPGRPDGLPMAQMAAEITETLRQYRVNVLVDMHESWAFFNGRPQNGTAYLGQTVATSQDETARTLARETVAAVNDTIRYSWERLFDRNNPDNPPAANGSPPTMGGGSSGGGVPNAGQSVPGGTSSLGLPRHVPGLSSLLVEMGQQQTLERRIDLHVQVATEVATRLGIAQS